MGYNNENNTEALVAMQNFQLPDTMSDVAFSNEDLAEDMDGLQMSFQRVKIPAGGALQFELPGEDPENPDYAKNLEGVILYNHASGAYWQEGSEYDENSTPLCSTVDGKVGIGEPGGSCAICPFNQFRSAVDGKGKACKNMRVLYLLCDGDYLPIQLTLPPTSIRPFNDFYNVAFATKRRATYGSVVQIGLKRMDNGNLYSVATFKKLYDFSGEKLAQVKACADSFREQIKMMLQQRAADTEVRCEDVFSADDGYVMQDDGNGFCITSGTIDGDREELPA
ncbi:MAG: hypothetical protein PHY23_06360 [Oscillospiraceae bacterium]|nr:hypothetical protein [Oscillospiraceae bacterium]